mgnify:CR=1 FL=1|tara:strand:- start:94 stop:1431 length:1338 start_codon:yes stop_codon:yes gene_type:complete
MIISSNKVAFVREPPFTARISSDQDDSDSRDGSSGSVSFAKGKIFQCFNNGYEGQQKSIENERQAFTRGAAYHFPKNMSESFEWQLGDRFYLRTDKEGESSQIIKMSAIDDSQQEGDILIWEIRNENGTPKNTQYLSDHVYLQDREQYRLISFHSTLLEENEDGSKRFRMNGGWVNVFDKGLSKFLPSFEYTLKKDEERFYYVQIDTEITEESALNSVSDEQLVYIKEYKVNDITIIHREEEITAEEITANEPYIGQTCAVDINSAQARNFDKERKKGKHWYKIPDSGNVDVKFESVNVDGDVLQAVVRKVTLGPDKDEDLITTHFTIGSNLGDEKRPSNCEYPSSLPFERELITRKKDDETGEVEEGPPAVITGRIKHIGHGVYEEKRISVPSLLFSLSDEEGGEGGGITLEDAFPASNPCGSPIFFITRQEKPRTSFLSMRKL